MKDFGTHLAIEHLKTDYPFFLIGALALDEKGEYCVRTFQSTDFNGNLKLIEKELAAKMIQHLQQYV